MSGCQVGERRPELAPGDLRTITDYLDSTSWTVTLALMRAPRWMPYPGQGRAERARIFLWANVLRVVAERRASGERHR